MSAETHISYGQLQSLIEVSDQINSNLGLAPLLDRILDVAVDRLGAEKGLILLRDDPSSELQLKAARAIDRSSVDNVVAMSRSIIGRVGTLGRPVLIRNAPEMSPQERPQSMHVFGIRSVICVPLMSRGQLAGAIYLDTTDQASSFKEEDLPFVEAFANLAAVAIENAKINDELRHLNVNLERLVAERTAALEQRNRELGEAYSDLEAAQLQVVRSEKMASLGKLVAGVADELNTPLASINSGAESLVLGAGGLREKIEAFVDQGEQTDRDSRKIARTLLAVEELSESVRRAGGRIAAVVQALRNFARLDEAEIQQADIHEGLDSAVELIQQLFHDRIDLTKSYGELPSLRCQPAQLNQAFMNLLVNACEAIEGRGAVRISTEEKCGNVRVEIADDGRGIAEADLARVFDPGFTTKGVRVGTGLGLPIVHQIVDDHGGEVSLVSEPGRGTKAIVILPVGS